MKNIANSLATTLLFITGLAVNSSSCIAGDQPEANLLSGFKNINVDAKPMARMWFPDAGAGADDNDFIEEHIKGMAGGGFGGVEIALLADETTYTTEQAKTIGWGTENWKNLLKKVLRAANSIEGGFKVDITITAHWPPFVNTIDPNDREASTELSYNYRKVIYDDLLRNTAEIPLPVQKTSDGKRHRFYFTDNLVDAYLVKVVRVDTNGAPVISFDSVIPLTGGASEFGGMAAGIPDDADSEEAFGKRPENNNFEGKINGEGLRKRMADWQFEYEVDLRPFASQLGQLNNDTTIAPGDWLLFGTFYRGTGQVLSGGGVITMYGGHYVVDYFSREGIQKVLDFWNENILNDPELLALLKENGSKVGASIFEDSIEASHSGPFWTFHLPGELDADYRYKDRLSLAVAIGSGNEEPGRGGPGGGMFGGPGGEPGGRPGGGPGGPGTMEMPPGMDMPEGMNMPFGPGGFGMEQQTPGKPEPVFEDDRLAKRIVQDYNLKLGELYESEHASVISEWASGFNYTYRAQGYRLTGLDIAGAAAALDIPEGDNATSGDGLRNLSSAVNLYDKKFLSMEAITVIKCAVPWTTIVKELNSNFSHGVNRVILHGTSYAKTFDNNHTTWPGWGWGGGSVGVEQFTSWNHRQIYWEDVNIFSDYVSRNQTLLQNGIAKVDIAVMNNTASSFNILRGNSMQSLLDNGYSYNILSEAMLRSENARVSNGRLYADGPAYKVLILNNATTLSVSALQKIISFADAGLPVIIYGEQPEAVYGTEKAGNNDTELRALLNRLKTNKQTSIAAERDEILKLLSQNGIRPSAAYQIEGLEASRILDRTDGTTYYYIFNNSMNDIENQVISLEGNGIPYILEAWTDKVIPLADYIAENGNIIMPVTLKSEDSKIIAISPSPAESGFPAAKNYSVASLTGGSVSYEQDKMVFLAGKPGDYTVTYSDGRQQSVKVRDVMQPVDLNSGWDLTIYSFGPDDSADNLDKNNQLIDPTRSRRTRLDYNNIPLTTWNNLPVTEDRLNSLGTRFNRVTGMKDVSGIGYYSVTFTLSSGWKENMGAYIDIAHGEDMITKITINGHVIDKIDQMNDMADIGNYLSRGENTLEIKLDTTSKNRISLEIGPPTRENPQNSENTANGVTSVKLIPYTRVVL